MTAEADVHVGEVSSPKDVPNGNATAEGSREVSVNGSGNGSGTDFISGDAADADLNFVSRSGERSDDRVVEECNKQSPDQLKAEDRKIVAESQDSVVIVSDNHVDQESKENATGDRGIDADQNCESGKVVVINGDQSMVQENESDSSENVQRSTGDVTIETVARENHVADSPADLEQNPEAAASRTVEDNQLDPPVTEESEESERVLANGQTPDGILETRVNELVDSNQETPELTTSAELAESLPSHDDSENIPVATLQTASAGLDDVKRETEIGNLDMGGSEISDSHPVDNATVIEVENGPVGNDNDVRLEIETEERGPILESSDSHPASKGNVTEADNGPAGNDNDVRLEIETEERGSTLESSDSHPASKGNVTEAENGPVGNDNDVRLEIEMEERGSILENSDFHPASKGNVIETANGPVRNDDVSNFPSSDAGLETETEEKGSILANDGSNTKLEDSEGVIHCADKQLIPIGNAAAVECCKSDSVEKGSSLVNGAGADVKAESKIENTPVVSCRDDDDADVSESEVLSKSVISTSEVVHAENGQIQTAGGETDDKKYKEMEENDGIQVMSADIDDQRCTEVEGSEEIQATSAYIDNGRCKGVEETEEIQVNAAETDDQRFKEVEGSEENQVTYAEIDGQSGKEVEEPEEIQVNAVQIGDHKPKEVGKTGEIQVNAAEKYDQKPKEVEESEEIQVNAAEIDDQKPKEVEENEEIHVTSTEICDQRCKEVEENDGIQIIAAEIDDQVKEFEQNEEIQDAASESDDQRCKEVKEDEEIQVTGGEIDNKLCQGGEETEEIQFTRGESVDKACRKVEGIDGIHRNEASTSTPEGSAVDASETHNVGNDVVKRPFYYLIRVPKYDDENLGEQIKSAQSVVNEKTQSRDAIQNKIRTIRAIYKKYGESLEVALSEERAARELLKSKRQEIDSVQSMINKVKNAMSVEDIDGRIRNMEHMIAHETLPLKEEKQFIRDIKQLKQLREQFSSNLGQQDDVQQAFDQKDQIEERSKLLRKEADSLRENVLKAEVATQAVRKQHREESEKLKKLLGQFKAADDIRQEAYKHFQSLKKQTHDKNKYYWDYKDNAKQAKDLVSKGDKEALQHLCVNQVERVMERWNNNDEFRKEYVNSNVRSTLRRLKTLDGRSLGPDEEPPITHSFVSDKVAKDNSQLHISTLKSEKTEQVVPVKSERVDEKPISEVREQKIPTAKPKKPAKLSPSVNGPATVSVSDEIEKESEEEPKRSKEEEELARKEEELVRKAEELRKEEEAAKLKEQRRLEEKEKAKEALERKKRMAEKAQGRAAVRAQKEAEQKEKEREKRLRKKEKRKGGAAEDTGFTNEEESAPSSETTLLETPQTSELREKPTTATKRPQKPSQFTKQTTKAKSIPMPLRNRGKRRMQSWMWVLVAALVIFALFLLGNRSFSKFGLKGFGF